MTSVDVEVVVVGGGVAGAVAAHRLALAGREVALLERGAAPGEKNLSGGVLYTHALESVFPGFADAAPIERRVTRHVVGFLTPDAAVSLDYADARLATPANAVTVLRSRLDAWLVERCEEAGVQVMAGVHADALLRDGDRVVGVRAGDEELRAHVVVAADGVNSFLARQTGIRNAPTPPQLALGVKSVLGLPREAIEQRFALVGDAGAAYSFVGDATGGIAGGGFLYTNAESLSVGVVLRLDDLVRSGRSSADVHDRFLAHPTIAPLVAGGELLEYGAHLTIEDGPALARQALVRPGLVLVGDAAGLTLNTGLTLRGMDLAATSAVVAADVVERSLAAADPGLLDEYPAALARSVAGADLATYARAPGFLATPRLYDTYPALLADTLYAALRHDGTPRRHLVDVARVVAGRAGVRVPTILRDALAAARAL